jgi:translation initiation factor 2 subunit 1
MVKRKGLPRWGELVLCTVTRVTPFAAWCVMDEYEAEDGSHVEGMIHVSEVAGRWVKDIRKYVKPNKQYVAKVVRIDYQKGHLNLSLKRVTKFDKKEKAETFRREKRGMGIVNQIAKRVGKEEDELLKELESKISGEFDDLFAVFEEINEDMSMLDDIGLDKKTKDAIKEVVENNFRIKEKTVKASLDVTTTSSDGVKKLRSILGELEKETGAKVKYISAPKYQIELQTKKPKEAEKKIRAGLDVAMDKIKKAEGEGSYEMIK